MKKRIRKELIKFYVTPEEKELIQQNMALLGTDNMSAFLRKMAIDGHVIKLDLPELKELVSLLRYTSNNINQIAKRVNSTGRIYSEDISGIKDSMESLWTAANSILRRLASIPWHRCGFGFGLI